MSSNCLRRRQQGYGRLVAVRIDLPESIDDECDDLGDGVRVPQRFGCVRHRNVVQSEQMEILVGDHVAPQIAGGFEERFAEMRFRGRPLRECQREGDSILVKVQRGVAHARPTRCQQRLGLGQIAFKQRD